MPYHEAEERRKDRPRLRRVPVQRLVEAVHVPLDHLRDGLQDSLCFKVDGP